MTTATIDRPLTRYQQDIADSGDRFRHDTGGHEMAVLHDDGPYRHLRFRRPDTGMYWFDIITWPGCLTINGDMGSYTFSRDPDMFEFFRTGARYAINPDYWAEKIRCGQGGGNRDHVKEFSLDVFREQVAEYLETFFDGYLEDLADNDGQPLWPGLDEALLWEFNHGDLGTEDEARALLRDFRHTVYSPDHRRAPRVFTFGTDWWEWDLRTYAYPYLWCCHAIVWGIGQYDASHSTAEAVASRG